MKYLLWILFLLSVFHLACQDNANEKKRQPVSNIVQGDSMPTHPDSLKPKQLLQNEIAVLCYHQVHEQKKGEPASAITISPTLFAAQIKMLHDSGYNILLPADLYEHFTSQKALPAKAMMITFDDNTESQYTNALPVLNRYGYKAVFFVMTVSINKSMFMTSKQLQDLCQQGHVIGCHTWDHHNVTTYNGNDWQLQLDKPLKQLQQITGRPVEYFAYPYGAWNAAAVEELKKRNIKLAFILHTKQSATDPLLTMRRLMVTCSMTPEKLYTSIAHTFH